VVSLYSAVLPESDLTSEPEASVSPQLGVGAAPRYHHNSLIDRSGLCSCDHCKRPHTFLSTTCMSGKMALVQLQNAGSAVFPRFIVVEMHPDSICECCVKSLRSTPNHFWLCRQIGHGLTTAEATHACNVLAAVLTIE